MSKRRVDEDEVEEDSDIDLSSTDDENEEEVNEEGDEEGDDEDEEVVNVDFDYFDLNPEVDFHATKTFLRQLFGDDEAKIDISGLADLLLKKGSAGTTIKTEGIESDPFALLSVINLNDNLTKPAIKSVLNYVYEKTSTQLQFNLFLKKLLSTGKTTKDSTKQLKVGLIISERMINMPVEVVPPMYKMLLEEMEKAEDAHEKYEFDYFLIISKVYKLVHANIQDDDEDEGNKSKKKKKTNQEPQVEMDYFHYEDMILEDDCKFKGIYDYSTVKQDTDSRRVFTDYGIDPKLSLIFLDKEQLAKSVPIMAEKFPPF
ncbi:protein BCP1 [Scheffersomyces coipomensis]|uniref:protein BCP1 n=1 Tax=Scheffersomyces coipomensis TaxID=1788519 RepID=UPI00315DE471